MRNRPFAPMNFRRSSSGTSARVTGPGMQVALQAVELVHEVAVELGLEVGERGLRDLAIGRPQALHEDASAVSRSCSDLGGQGLGRLASAARSKRRLRSRSAWVSRSRSTGLERPTRTGATSGAKLLMIAIFSACSSGITRSTESTSDTEGSRSKAACFRRSSSSDVRRRRGR